MRQSLDGFRGPGLMSASDRSELCRICGRRRGEHSGTTGVMCPAGAEYHPTSAFVPSGEYGPESPDVARCWTELEQRRAGRVAVFRRSTVPDKLTGAPRTSSFTLVEYVAPRGGRRG